MRCGRVLTTVDDLAGRSTRSGPQKAPLFEGAAGKAGAGEGPEVLALGEGATTGAVLMATGVD